MSERLYRGLRVLWMPLDMPWQPGSGRVRHCCTRMEMALEHDCVQHETPFDCPDTVMVYHEPFNEYGLPIRDGGASYVIVMHCPWCGTELPASARDAWFDAVETAGLAEVPADQLPAAYLTCAWRIAGDH